MELFFSSVYYEVARSPQRGAAFNVYYRLLRLYHQLLAATTDWMATRPTSGCLEQLLELLRDRDPELTVITFNQDLVLENVAARLAPLRTWCLRDLYGELPLEPRVVMNEPQARVFQIQHQIHHAAPFHLLKLHGSLNWVLASRDEVPRHRTLFPRGQDKDVYLLNTRTAPIQAQLMTMNGRGRNSWHLWPLIVPPIYDKARITGMDILQRLSERAIGAIAGANRMVIVGYSLPDADMETRMLLRKALAMNPQLQSVDWINPEFEAALKIQGLAELPSLRMYTSIDRYVRFS
jgi:hypothetical protein